MDREQVQGATLDGAYFHLGTHDYFDYLFDAKMVKSIGPMRVCTAVF